MHNVNAVTARQQIRDELCNQRAIHQKYDTVNTILNNIRHTTKTVHKPTKPCNENIRATYWKKRRPYHNCFSQKMYNVSIRQAISQLQKHITHTPAVTIPIHPNIRFYSRGD